MDPIYPHMYSDKEYLILENINDNSSQIRQRDLAGAAVPSSSAPWAMWPSTGMQPNAM